ncbi:MAG: AEC family transporter [Campylobacterales bacterium]|nr:AEC family transporter [Campylobacterales bacterium]
MSSVIPILLLFLSGYVFSKFLKEQNHSHALIDIILYFIFPAFIIYKIHFLEFNSDIYRVVFLGFCAFSFGVVLSLLVGNFLKLNKNTTAMIMISTAFGNTSFLGFAFVESLYGDYALSLAIFYDQIAVMVLLSIFSPMIVNYATDQSFQAKKIIKSIITFPPTIAFVIAIASRTIEFPIVFTNYLEKISLLLVPIVVFAVGMKFQLRSINNRLKEVGVTLAIKMVLIPLLIYLIATIFFQIDIATKTAILESAMPPMVLATVIAIKNGLDEELGLASLGLGMILSFVTIPLIAMLLN